MSSCDLQADGDSSFGMSTDRLKGFPKKFFEHLVKKEKVITKSAIFHQIFKKAAITYLFLFHFHPKVAYTLGNVSVTCTLQKVNIYS